MIIISKQGIPVIVDDDFSPPKGGVLSVQKNKNVQYARYGKQYLHRIVIGASPGQIVDHINGDGLDNRRSNLRFASKQSNKANQKFGIKRKTSNFIGVSVDKIGICMQYRKDGKSKKIRGFVNEEEAAKAYDFIVKEIHGSLALLNFPD